MHKAQISDELLNQMRMKTDPEAEALIRGIIQEKDFTELKKLFQKLSYNSDSDISKNLPESINQYFQNEQSLPEWADPEKIKLAQEVFLKYGPEIAITLCFKSLPLCYTSKSGAHILALSGRMTAQPDGNTEKLQRRLLETAQMVINVMAPGGLSAMGDGIITVKKVRLYHAAIRVYIEQSQHVNWDVSDYGKPINQEELIGTQLAFSALIIEGLEQFKIQLTAEEKDAYMHCWNIVGHFVGVDPQLMPNTYEEGFELGLRILKRNCQKSEDGILLTHSLLEFGENFIPGKLFDGLPLYFTNLFLPSISKKLEIDLNEVLDVQKKYPFLLKMMIGIYWFFEKAFGFNNFILGLFPKLNLRILQGMIRMHSNINDVPFSIPDSLKSNWKLK